MKWCWDLNPQPLKLVEENFSKPQHGYSIQVRKHSQMTSRNEGFDTFVNMHFSVTVGSRKSSNMYDVIY